MDISELQLKINKKEAVSDLQAVTKELEKTGDAADGLIDTLKNIGISVGFGKLVKDSMELNSTFSALETKFQSIFKDGFDNKLFKSLKSELTVSDMALKSILSTTGQFAKGLNQSTQYVKQFSTELAKAAADYATYQGKNTSSEILDYANKFGKATLGEVGELKNIGIIIDTTSQKFKDAIKVIQETTGATEAQAKQMEIQRQLLEQVKIAAGSAATNMYDGWAQLNKLFDQFKEILGDVGAIFSTAFAPILDIFNSILEIPFVKSTAAWAIAIGSVIIGYTGLIKTLNKIKSILDKGFDLEKLKVVSAAWTKETVNVRKEYERIFAIAKRIPGMERFQKYKSFFDLASKDKKMFEHELTIAAPGLAAEFGNAQKGFEQLKKDLQDIGVTMEQVSKSGIKGLNQNMLMYLPTLETLKKAMKSTTIVTIAAAAAEAVLKVARLGMGGVADAFTNTLKNLKLGFAKFFQVLAQGATGFGAVKAIFLTLSAVLVKLAAVVALFDAIKVIFNAISGREWNAGTITKWFADWFYGIGKLEEESKKLSEVNRTLYNNLVAVEDLKKKLEEIHLNEAIKNMLPSEAIKALQDKSDEMKIKMKNLAWIIDNFGEAKKRGMIDVPADDKGEYRKNLQEKLNQLTREYYTTQNEIKNKTKNLIDLNTQYAKTIDELGKQMQGIYSTFAYGYKNGQFGNYTEDQANIQRNIRLQELNEKYNSLIGKRDLQSMKLQKETLQEIFNLTREKAKYELDVLWKQRETAISNMKLMTDIVKQATGLRSSSQRFIEAASMEAISMQSRRYESMSKSELAPMIEQQKQIKVIETNMLKKQDGFDRVLNNIYNQLVEATKRIGKSQGVSGSTINAVNPL